MASTKKKRNTLICHREQLINPQHASKLSRLKGNAQQEGGRTARKGYLFQASGI